MNETIKKKIRHNSYSETYDVSDLVDESWRVLLGIEREEGGNIPGILFASCPAPDPLGTSSKGDSEPASSSDDSSATPR